MDKFYYESSNGNVRDSDGELYHGIGDWFKKDAKYIKREWKNGKWVYTYPEEKSKEPKSSAIEVAGKTIPISKNTEPKSSAIKVGGKTISISKDTEKIVDKINAVGNKIEEAIENAKMKREADKAERKKDWEESKIRGTKKAKEEATRNDGAFVVGKGGLRERGETGFVDTDRLLSGTRTIVAGGTEIRTIQRGKLDRFIDTAKEYVKDRLGYDERDAAKAAIAKYEVAKRAEKAYKTEADATKAFMGTVNPTTGEKTYTNEQKKELEKMARTERLMREHTDKTSKVASEAAKAYVDTPLAKIEKARKVGEEWLDKLFGKKR